MAMFHIAVSVNVCLWLRLPLNVQTAIDDSDRKVNS